MPERCLDVGVIDDRPRIRQMHQELEQIGTEEADYSALLPHSIGCVLVGAGFVELLHDGYGLGWLAIIAAIICFAAAFRNSEPED